MGLPEPDSRAGEHHPETLISMANLAMTYSTQGKLNDAQKLEEEVLELKKKIIRELHPETLRSMANLAVTYHSQGKLLLS